MTTTGLQVQRAQVKLGAASGIVGALLALVVNPAHGDLPADPGLDSGLAALHQALAADQLDQRLLEPLMRKFRDHTD